MIISKLKKSVIIASSVLTLCIVGAFVTFNPFEKRIVHSDYTIHNEEGLVQNADIIVEGTITDTAVKKLKYLFSPEKTYINDEDKQLYTVSTMEITKVIKGDFKLGDKIEIKQTGDGKKVIDQDVLDNGGYFQKNSTQLVFLKNYTEFKVPYGVINPMQSVYTVGDNGAIKTGSNNKLFTNNKARIQTTSNLTLEEQLIKK